ncbi:unnamed protein product [Mytilus coruscus]|uniref:MULE transposase domain-containing protein n=1 Tax=Mytilus coruscus TaxID=42192 RepID=A0A6J8ELM8_MYTCO|nr:unnamed protein product [Mytilus coruscus]
MTDKHIGSYRQIMRHIKRRYRRLTNNDLSPQNIVSDFETGMITAAETEFPQARMCGCFFHFCRSIWRRLQKEGLRNAFNRRLALRRCVRKMMAIAYLPMAVVRQNFQLFRQDATTQRLCHNCPGLRELLTYFQRNYLNGQFSPVIWNVYQRNMDNRTNNHVECNFQQEMERSSWQTSSKLVVLLKKLKTEERRGALSVAAVRRGDRPPVRKRKYRLLQERIDRLTNSYRNGQRTLNQYWDAMVYTVAQFN